MFFRVTNHNKISVEKLRQNTLLDAYFIIQHYPMQASDLLMDVIIKQKYKTTLKDMCIELLLNLTFYKSADNDLILMFKDARHEAIASLITYGTGAVPGSKILQIALKD